MAGRLRPRPNRCRLSEIPNMSASTSSDSLNKIKRVFKALRDLLATKSSLIQLMLKLLTGH